MGGLTDLLQSLAIIANGISIILLSATIRKSR